ncbi:hypothetical protein QVD17_38677 [Tagetes erecta]|uniref:Uncharacterized protein n=1 Tax=Tagetes erecta TaxID=13708 RepID=A0AAD8JQX4_TARER|nr:hypothetical protein QVD17_38677 [Tagetes erecta]
MVLTWFGPRCLCNIMCASIRQQYVKTQSTDHQEKLLAKFFGSTGKQAAVNHSHQRNARLRWCLSQKGLEYLT